MTEWLVFGVVVLVFSAIAYSFGRAAGYARCYEDMTDRDKRRRMERDEARFDAVVDDD